MRSKPFGHSQQAGSLAEDVLATVLIPLRSGVIEERRFIGNPKKIEQLGIQDEGDMAAYRGRGIGGQEISFIEHIGIVLRSNGIQSVSNDRGQDIGFGHLQVDHDNLVTLGIFRIIEYLMALFVGERVAQHSWYIAQGDRINIGNLG